jgi:hypothetical protein
MRIKFHLSEQANSNIFNKELVDKYLNNAIKGQLGKVGLAKYTCEISNVLPFDFEALIVLTDISSDDLLVFWSSLAFNSSVKVELREMNLGKSKNAK